MSEARYASADEFRAMREKKGLTQKAVAELLRVDETTVQRWEAGISRCRRAYLEQLQKARAKK